MDEKEELTEEKNLKKRLNEESNDLNCKPQKKQQPKIVIDLTL